MGGGVGHGGVRRVLVSSRARERVWHPCRTRDGRRPGAPRAGVRAVGTRPHSPFSLLAATTPAAVAVAADGGRALDPRTLDAVARLERACFPRADAWDGECGWGGALGRRVRAGACGTLQVARGRASARGAASRRPRPRRRRPDPAASAVRSEASKRNALLLIATDDEVCVCGWREEGSGGASSAVTTPLSLSSLSLFSLRRSPATSLRPAPGRLCTCPASRSRQTAGAAASRARSSRRPRPLPSAARALPSRSPCTSTLPTPVRLRCTERLDSRTTGGCQTTTAPAATRRACS